MLTVWLTGPKTPKPLASFIFCTRTVFNEAIPSSRKAYWGNSIADSMAPAVGMRDPSYCLLWMRAGRISPIPPGKDEKTHIKKKNSNWNEHAGSKVLAMRSWNARLCMTTVTGSLIGQIVQKNRPSVFQVLCATTQVFNFACLFFGVLTCPVL